MSLQIVKHLKIPSGLFFSMTKFPASCLCGQRGLRLHPPSPAPLPHQGFIRESLGIKCLWKGGKDGPRQQLSWDAGLGEALENLQGKMKWDALETAGVGKKGPLKLDRTEGAGTWL